jgi:coenzyme F420-0:L-glutamate ligase/coenzyme F420-1:gamma-L-glutamate ligase
MSGELRVLPVAGMPEVREGDRVGQLIAERTELEPGDVVVIAQKVVSKAEGQVRNLSEIVPSAQARELAEKLGKEAEFVELVLSESREVLREERVLITETHHGFVCANAGIDTSNLPEDGTVCLLPEDPDASARRIRKELTTVSDGAGASVPRHSTASHWRAVSGEGCPSPLPAVVIADSFGRAWRLGQAEAAIGCAGLQPIDDWRGKPDAGGRVLVATMIAIADEVAAAADLVRVKDSRVPAVIVRGLGHYVGAEDGPGAAALRRPPGEDLFR